MPAHSVDPSLFDPSLESYSDANQGDVVAGNVVGTRTILDRMDFTSALDGGRDQRHRVTLRTAGEAAVEDYRSRVPGHRSVPGHVDGTTGYPRCRDALSMVVDDSATAAYRADSRHAPDQGVTTCYFFLVVGVAGGAATPKAFSTSRWQVSFK